MASSQFTRICPVCGTSFLVWPHQANRKQFCSRECRKTTTSVEKTCEFCKKNFKVFTSNAKARPSRFCSMSCWRNSQGTGPTRVEIECKTCKSKVFVRRCLIRDGKAIYCSQKCRRAWESAPLEIRFKRCIGSKDENGCILWNAGCTTYGYGTIRSGGENSKSLYAHRVAWELANGQPVPDGLEIMHTCDNPPCVNPDHLVPGTSQDNKKDSISKDRNPRGERNGHAKLSDKEVIEARKLYESGNYTQQELADQLGVNRSTMSVALQGKTWKHI